MKKPKKPMNNVVSILKNSNKEPLPDGKVCSACGFEKPATTEHFYANPDGDRGLHSQCRKCRNKRERARKRSFRKANLKKARAQGRVDAEKWRRKQGMRTQTQRKEEALASTERLCTKCNKTKPVEGFRKNPALKTHTQRAAWCKSCSRIWSREYLRSKHWALRLTGYALGRHKKFSDEPSDITAEFLKEIYTDQAGRCTWFSIEMTLGVESGPAQISLDRIDNGRGYTQDNVHLVCHAANLARNKYTFEEFERFLDLVREEI